MLRPNKTLRQFVPIATIGALLLPLAGCGTWATEVGNSVNGAINVQDRYLDRPNQMVILKEREKAQHGESE